MSNSSEDEIPERDIALFCYHCCV